MILPQISRVPRQGSETMIQWEVKRLPEELQAQRRNSLEKTR